MKYQALRGTKDVLPGETQVWQYVENAVHNTFKCFGFDEIRTPIFEQTELFTRSIGDATDIVSKEMYTFPDKKGRSLTLRPEATAGVVRAALENELLIPGKETRFYYIGPMFRYERPQAGRFRQFYQAGVEIFGSSSPYSDADVILAGIELFKKLGIKLLETGINSVGCTACRPGYEKKLKSHLKENLNDLCGDCKTRFEGNILRIFDCKEEACKKIVSKAPVIREMLCDDCSSHLMAVHTLLKDNGVGVYFNEKLVRGLDYYTKTVFEIVSKDLGAQNAICGGGRYDKLVEDLGGKETPAVGMAIGLERLISVMDAQKVIPDLKEKPFIFIAALGEKAKQEALSIALALRNKGRRVEFETGDSSLKAQLKSADKKGARSAVIIGDNEILIKKYKLRDMQTGEEKEISPEEIREL